MIRKTVKIVYKKFNMARVIKIWFLFIPIYIETEYLK